MKRESGVGWGYINIYLQGKKSDYTCSMVNALQVSPPDVAVFVCSKVKENRGGRGIETGSREGARGGLVMRVYLF